MKASEMPITEQIQALGIARDLARDAALAQAKTHGQNDERAKRLSITFGELTVLWTKAKEANDEH